MKTRTATIFDLFSFFLRLLTVNLHSATRQLLTNKLFYVTNKYSNRSFSISILDGELEAQWLISAGFPQLVRAFEQVTEVNYLSRTLFAFSFERDYRRKCKIVIILL